MCKIFFCKYGKPYCLYDCRGGLKCNDLSNFAWKNLKLGSLPHNMYLCNDEHMIEKFGHYKFMTENDLKEVIKEFKEVILWLEKDMNMELEKLQDLYYSVQNKYKKELKVMALSMSKTNKNKWKGDEMIKELH